MPDLIILRLVPSEPMSGSDFTALLNGLTVTAFDITFAESGGVQLGAASGLANPHLGSTTNNNVNINNTRILQHYVDVTTGPLTVRHLEAAATAVIVASPPAGHPEYPADASFDIRLEFARAGRTILDRTVDYNAVVTTVGSLSTSQKTYFNMEASAYFTIPMGGGLDPNVAFVELPADGSPPRFDDLVHAIDLVLAKDPGGANADLAHRSPLTSIQSRSVAREIVWNRALYPTPDPPRSLGELYTRPPVDPSVDADEAEQDRMQFEAQLDGYHALHDAEALRLANFVFAASAAVACEVLSSQGAEAGLTFPLLTEAAGLPLKNAEVIFTQPGGLNPPLMVPAAYFYALGAMLPPQVSAPQRFDMARLATESRLLSEFQAAVDADAIAAPATPVTVAAAPAVNPDQAARRLHALGATTGSAPRVLVTPSLAALVLDWLNYGGAGEEIDLLFWTPESAAQPAAYLELVLDVVTDSHAPLISAIQGPPYHVARVRTPGVSIPAPDDLVGISDRQWRDFFLGEFNQPGDPPPPPGAPPRVPLLPPFTQPGTPQERVEAFIRHLQKFFTVPNASPLSGTVSVGAPPSLPLPVADVFAAFTSAYLAHAGIAFAFGVALDPAALQQSLADVFPGDAEAQAWLEQALETIDALFTMTDIGLPELRFSLMEALFARGFTSVQEVRALTEASFQEALTGTVAYPHAAALYLKAGAVGPPPPPPHGNFQPVNPDGLLTDCIPPLHLSPLGPMEYLHELLRVTAASTCEDPLPAEDPGGLGVLLAGRRGPLGDLLATRANLGTPLSVLDLVNESLESLAAGLPGATGGAVYDTAGDELAGHKLRQDGSHGPAGDRDPLTHDPQTLFAAVPEHSSPATPVAKPAAYDRLRSDFTAPELPYAQALDINRSYLRQLGTSRFAAMRRFRKEITEFVLDPAAEPAEFQRHLWRYPVRIEIAREYLGISPETYDLLFTQDIVTVPTPGRLLLRELYGYNADAVGGTPWSDLVVNVSEFLPRTGLTYCRFIELWRSEFVRFRRAGEDPDFPVCEPCCLDRLVIRFEEPSDPNEALRRLAVFIRLWRLLQAVPGARYSFAQLRDICDVLKLFNGGAINPDFIRQLAAFQMLRDNYRLPLMDHSASQPAATGAERTHLLALWVGETASRWGWAVDRLLDRIEDDAEARRHCGPREPEFFKVLAENLDSLSLLAGFDPATPAATWHTLPTHTLPTHTLRFAELLTKITLSEFSVGEMLFLFTVQEHLDGDDPFPLQDRNEALYLPFDCPEDLGEHTLGALRRKLLAVQVCEEDAAAWSWPRIEASLRDEFNYTAPTGAPDPLLSLGEHFFPSILEQHGQPVDLTKRQYRVDLPATSPLMWNTPPDGPFRYDAAARQLWTQLPLCDEAVNDKLIHLRPLTPDEQRAVRELYFSPRADLAPFAYLFANFSHAADRLIAEPEECERWAYFQREFARFHARCRIIAEHLAEHVAAVTGGDAEHSAELAWRLLRHLLADENFAQTSWEADSGQPPDVTWGPQPNGGAFAALLGLTGTGLLGEFSPEGHPLVWRELRGPMSAFDPVRNEWNSPAPTVLPAMSLTFSPDDERSAALRNGLALRHTDGKPLGGAQGFTVRWSGLLLVEEGGCYEFLAGAPTPDGEEPDYERCAHHHWRVTLARGQKTWYLLNHHWPGEEAPSSRSVPLTLRPGAYQIVVEFQQRQPAFSRPEDACPQHTGFQVKYTGPDSEDRLVAIPLARLYRDLKDGTLGAGIELGGAPQRFLQQQYPSTVRDIRRTYQRAFKALLFARRFGLSATPLRGDTQSEIGYLLDHGNAFLGTSYFESGGFSAHHAFLNFNFLPVGDPYRPPLPTQDRRVQPTARRQQALFDWWERIFDYVTLRAETRPARERPAWVLFYEAAKEEPDDPAQLLRHLGVDIHHAPLVLRYYRGALITGPDLEDERWAVRVWHGEKWIRALLAHFVPRRISAARPDLWASDSPEVVEAGETVSGNANLTTFYRNGCIENGEPRRYQEIKQLNDGLRERARAALLAYLCGMDRVPLPWGAALHARAPRELSDLLLQDVEAGLCERASRIEDAISAIQTFIQRARLGLEPGFPVTPAFVQLWDRRFATFHVWEACKRREVYRENWIAWDELRKARETEAFRFLESELRRATLTAPAPGGMEWWPGERPPAHPSLLALQARGPAAIQLFRPGPVPEGLGLLGTPERDARPSWLAPVLNAPPEPPPPPPEGGGVILLAADSGETSNGGNGSEPSLSSERLPLWIQAAIRLGTRFIRVAAAGGPPASTQFVPRRPAREAGCCVDCCEIHPPTIDEYYFWIQDARYFDPVSQDADVGVQPPETMSDWHRPEELPALLNWDSGPTVHLFWRRFHHGEFQQPRRSDEGVRIDVALLSPGQVPQLDFKGRTGDSLRFEISAGAAPPGYLDPTPPGFRYDIATDSATVVPLVAAPLAPATTGFPGGLGVYPFFAYFVPGAHLEPPSLFSVALAVAGTLRAHCRPEAALKWYELVFNPLRQDNSWAQCPKPDVPPEPTPPVILSTHPTGIPDTPGSPDTPSLQAHGPGGDNDPCCPNEPISDDIARDRAVLLQYLETLLQWGDALLCRNSPESFRQAAVLFQTLERVLGPHPTRVFSQDEGGNSVQVSAFVPRPAPLNPRLLALYDREADRLALVHHCLNGHRLRAGRPNLDMPFWGNSPLRDGWQTGEQTCLDESHWCLSCCSAYRFAFLVQKALELASEVRGFGAELLAAYEKGDAESLGSLRATHERQLLELALQVRQNQWRDADWQVQALRKTKEGAQARQRYFDTLIQNGLNAGETGYEALLGVSIGSRIAGNVSEAVAQGVGVTPDVWFGVAGMAGTPLEFQQLPVGNKLAASFATAARILNAVAENAGAAAAISLAEGGWDRREEEWRQEVEVIGIEIEQIERQVLAAERRRDFALRELNNHQRQIEQAVEVLNFLRDKFTSQELYLFHQQEAAALHHQMYELALHTAWEAQRAFNYERGLTARTFLPEEAWDSLHEGLLAGERLLLSLRRMEKAYLDANCREYELTKHVSLRLNFPLAFLHLQMTGYCEIQLPEWMFDLDYPGHYMRRIKNVTLTIPCVVGPYTGVHCRLTLLSSTTRVDPRLGDAPARCCEPDDDGVTHPASDHRWTGREPAHRRDPQDGSDAYRALPDDPRIVRTYAATEAIATSSGQNDSGLFELSFRDERYLPFEFAGAVSRWRIELPPENNQFDFETLADLVLHLNYTAREGGDLLRQAANRIAQEHLPGDGLRFFDVRHELPDAWQAFRSRAAGREARRELLLRLIRSMFPFVPTHRPLRVRQLQLFVEAPGADPSASLAVEFLVGHHSGHTHEEHCDCEVLSFSCIASADWPCLYHGVLDVQLGPLSRHEPHDLGAFRFPCDLEQVSRVFLVCGYTAA